MVAFFLGVARAEGGDGRVCVAWGGRPAVLISWECVLFPHMSWSGLGTVLVEKIIKDCAKERLVFPAFLERVATAAESPFLREESTEFLGFPRGPHSPGSWAGSPRAFYGAGAKPTPSWDHPSLGPLAWCQQP